MCCVYVRVQVCVHIYTFFEEALLQLGFTPYICICMYVYMCVCMCVFTYIPFSNRPPERGPIRSPSTRINPVYKYMHVCVQ